MNKFAALICLAFAVSGPALAQDKAAPAAKAPSAKQAAQQERMKNCNMQATDKKLAGDARKSFMSACLKGEVASPAQTAQQEKMKSCNKQAGDKQMKGEERKKFMSACLKS